MDTQPLYVLIYRHRNNQLWYVISLSKDVVDAERNNMTYAVNEKFAMILFDGTVEVGDHLNIILGDKAFRKILIQAILTGKKEGQRISSNERVLVKHSYPEAQISNRECTRAAHENRRPFGMIWNKHIA